MFEAHTKRIDECAARLAVRLPFISTIFSGMRREVTEEGYPTASVKGMHVRFNPHFMDCLDDEELMFVAAHEALHVAFLHSYRIGDRDPAKWNRAGDACINLELTRLTPPLKMPKVNEKITALYGGGKSGENFGVLLPWVTADMDAETVYQKLQDEEDTSSGWGGTGDLEADDGQGGEDGDLSEAEVITMVTQAAKVAFAQGQGAEKGMIDRLLGVARASTTDWKEELRSVATLSARNDYNYRRFNRRFTYLGVYLPTLYSEEVGEMVIGIDESGSMSQHQLDCINMELIPIVEDVRPSRVIVMYCHTHVHRVDVYEQGEDIRLRLSQSGGTDMMDILREIQRRELRPAAVIIFSDLETPCDSVEPDYPLLWGAVGAQRGTVLPIGRRVEVPV